MALLEWQENFCTGIESVDYEHELLVSLIDNAYEQLGNNPSREMVIAFLGVISSTFSSHFALEEAIMRQHGYGDYEAHSAGHRELMQQLDAIRESVESDEKFDPLTLRETLVSWFISHFRVDDARFHGAQEQSI